MSTHTRGPHACWKIELFVCRVESISSPVVVVVVLRLSSSAPTSSLQICHVIQRRSDCFVCFLLFVRSFVYRFQYPSNLCTSSSAAYTSFGYRWLIRCMAKRLRGQASETGVEHGTTDDTAAHRKQFREHQCVLCSLFSPTVYSSIIIIYLVAESVR